MNAFEPALLTLQACKEPAAPSAQPTPPVAVRIAPQPVARAVPVALAEPQNEADVIAGLGREAAAATQFDSSAIPETTATIPPFPYVAFPFNTTTMPGYPVSFKMAKLHQPNFDMSYDVYEGAVANAQAVTVTGAPPAAPQPLDINALPVKSTALPPFPYLAYPAPLATVFQRTAKANFDAVGFIVGKQLRMVEGKVEVRAFYNRHADISQMATQRNDEAALKGLGAVKVNTVPASDPALIAAIGNVENLKKKLRVPGKNIWIALMFQDDNTCIVVTEEKTMEQTVTLVSAATMHTELAAKGHIPLYINFDTDKATIRADGKPAVDEIAALLKSDAKLK
ncbi:hypothetical protein [Massilia sp. S19_KUP03_FR1]|uniref:hypothetical protein n=1 Tax=Massilia sp. S19_KUP03_FR1 TaxID=3025503 RepID=UPI002FCDB433